MDRRMTRRAEIVWTIARRMIRQMDVGDVGRIIPEVGQKAGQIGGTTLEVRQEDDQVWGCSRGQ